MRLRKEMEQIVNHYKTNAEFRAVADTLKECPLSEFDLKRAVRMAALLKEIEELNGLMEGE